MDSLHKNLMSTGALDIKYTSKGTFPPVSGGGVSFGVAIKFDSGEEVIAYPTQPPPHLSFLINSIMIYYYQQHGLEVDDEREYTVCDGCKQNMRCNKVFFSGQPQEVSVCLSCTLKLRDGITNGTLVPNKLVEFVEKLSHLKRPTKTTSRPLKRAARRTPRKRKQELDDEW